MTHLETVTQSSIPPLVFSENTDMIQVGWREWVRLPELDLPDMRAKIDTGAKTSALHAFEVAPIEKNGEKWVRFRIRPRKSISDLEHTCEAKVVDERIVKDSGGHKEMRYVIKTQVVLGNWCWDIEMTLTDRDNMSFLILLGREALGGLFVVNSVDSFHQGRPQIETAEPLTLPETRYLGK